MTQPSSCQDDFDVESLTVEQTEQILHASIQPLTDIETVPLMEALDRVLAVEVQAPINVPGDTNSAMDGYALRGADLPNETPTAFTLIGSSFAGYPFTGKVGCCECVRIMTGGVMPDGADTVVIQERVEIQDKTTIQISPGEHLGQNVRAAGEDIARGNTVLSPGCRLTPADIGLLASIGLPKIEVIRRPRVAFFSTGDELREVGETLDPGCLYNSNRYTLSAMLRRMGMEWIDFGVAHDDPQAIQDILQQARDQADLVITSGGVSVGEADHVRNVLEQVGQIEFWKIAIKPGRPLAFGRLGPAYFFGLPGNPVSVMVTFYQFVRPALLMLSGATEPAPMRLRVATTTALHKRPGRVELQRGILSQDANLTHTVAGTGAQGSGILTSMSTANCFIVLPMDQAQVDKGELVDVIPFSEIV